MYGIFGYMYQKKHVERYNIQWIPWEWIIHSFHVMHDDKMAISEYLKDPR